VGAFDVERSAAAPPDLRAHGVLHHDGTRYLKFAGSGRAFLKVEHGSPENLLAYGDFDQTFDTGGHGKDPSARFLHTYAPHAQDALPDDPTWQGGKGANLLGAINYLASRGVNSSYFLTYTLDGGDGKDVWPWTAPDVRDRFDVSKLAQWDRVFAHQQACGMVLNLLTQETENDQGLDGGDLGPTRKLYYRELVSATRHCWATKTSTSRRCRSAGPWTCRPLPKNGSGARPKPATPGPHRSMKSDRPAAASTLTKAQPSRVTTSEPSATTASGAT